MASEPATQLPITPDEYLALERDSPNKHEYFRGEVFAMAGASPEHALIVVNHTAELRNALRKGVCRTFGSDTRVFIPETGLYTYPDVSVACPPEFKEDSSGTLLNPSLLIEVLSDTTEAYDRGKKFEHYRSIASLKDYVLVSQYRMFIEQYVRQQDGQWLFKEIRSGDSLRLASMGAEIEMNEIYLHVFSS